MIVKPKKEKFKFKLRIYLDRLRTIDQIDNICMFFFYFFYFFLLF